MRLLSSVLVGGLLLLASACVPAPQQGEMLAHEPSLAVTTGGAFVAWHGGRGQESSIYVQQVDARDRPIGKPVSVSDERRFAYEPDLIAAGDRLAVAWYEKDAATGRLSAWLAGLTERGEREWLVQLGAGDDAARNAVVRLVGNELAVAWIEQPAADDGSNLAAVWHQRFTFDGKPLMPPRKIGEANRDTWNLNAAVANGDFVVVYDAALGTRAHELQMLEAGNDGVHHQTLSADDGHASLYPDLQLNPSGQAALTWFDERDGNQEVYLAAAPFADFARGVLPSGRRVTHSEADSIGAYVAWNGSTIGLAWTDEQDGDRDVFGQTFSSAGAPLGPMRNLERSPKDAGVPAIRASGDGFLVAWNDYTIEPGAASHMSIGSSVLKLARLPRGD